MRRWKGLAACYRRCRTPCVAAHCALTAPTHLITCAHISASPPSTLRSLVSLSSVLPPSPAHLRRLSTHEQPPLRKKVTVLDVQRLFTSRTPLTMVTAYTYPSAVHVDTAGIDILLVGDSLGMVELGYETTLPVTVDEMLHHAKAVSRGAERPLLVADLPFGSYEASEQQAHSVAVRFLKEAGMDAVKLEGGHSRAPTVRCLVDAGIAVMGHIGLTPQHISTLGGFRAQGRTLTSAHSLLHEALELQAAGVFSLVVECVPAPVAAAIQRALSIPVIGIGAGGGVAGQVLVYHDLLGMFQHAHHKKVSPRFSKRYGNIGADIQRGLEEYAREVRSGAFPGEQYSPYRMSGEDDSQVQKAMDEEASRWKQRWQHSQRQQQQQQQHSSSAIAATDDTINLY